MALRMGYAHTHIFACAMPRLRPRRRRRRRDGKVARERTGLRARRRLRG